MEADVQVGLFCSDATPVSVIYPEGFDTNFRILDIMVILINTLIINDVSLRV